MATGGVTWVVIVTVDGALARPSLTINCAMYVPDLSATNVGETVLAPVSAAVLPAGRAVSVHA